MGVNCVVCKNCGFNESKQFDVFPEEKKSQKAKGDAGRKEVNTEELKKVLTDALQENMSSAGGGETTRNKEVQTQEKRNRAQLSGVKAERKAPKQEDGVIQPGETIYF